jgi:hypothetical protein
VCGDANHLFFAPGSDQSISRFGYAGHVALGETIHYTVFGLPTISTKLPTIQYQFPMLSSATAVPSGNSLRNSRMAHTLMLHPHLSTASVLFFVHGKLSIVLVGIASDDIVPLAAPFLFANSSTISLAGGAAFSYNHKQCSIRRIVPKSSIKVENKSTSRRSVLYALRPTHKLVTKW